MKQSLVRSFIKNLNGSIGLDEEKSIQESIENQMSVIEMFRCKYC